MLNDRHTIPATLILVASALLASCASQPDPQVTDDGLGVVADMDARGSVDSSGTPTAPVDLVQVHIDTAVA